MTTQTKTIAPPPPPPRQPMKVELALELLIKADDAGQFVYALDAARAYGDSAWHSTVAGLRGKGLEFLQRPYHHQHRHGGRARYEEYRLAPSSREKAERLLASYRKRP